jgi:hypothetical protein
MMSGALQQLLNGMTMDQPCLAENTRAIYGRFIFDSISSKPDPRISKLVYGILFYDVLVLCAGPVA